MTAEYPIPHGLAEALAQHVHRQLRPQIPVDLSAVARHLDVSSVTFRTLVEEGRVTWADGRPRIELRQDRPATRTRFTLAHELGHVLIAGNNSAPARRYTSLAPNDEETLCDWIAAALLMPHDWMTPYARRDPYNLSLLRLVANKAEVSLSAAAVRLSEVGRRPCILLRWRTRQRQWLLVGQAGLPRTQTGYIEMPPDTARRIDALPARRDTWASLNLLLDGVPLAGQAHIDRGPTTCLTLFINLD